MDGRNGRDKTRQTRNKHSFQCMIGPENSRRNGERERERGGGGGVGVGLGWDEE